MTSAANLAEQYHESISGDVQEIKRLQNKISAEKKILLADIQTHLKNNLDENLDFKLLNKEFTREDVVGIIRGVMEVRTIRPEEINEEFLFILECSKDEALLKDFKESFSSFPDELKVKVSLSCQGINILLNQAQYMADFLLDGYNLHKNYVEEKNYTQVCGYNFETSQGTIRIITEKNNTEQLKDISKNLYEISRGGYINRIIDVFEHTLSQFGSIYIVIRDEEQNIIDPVVKTGSYSEYKPKGETWEDKMHDALIYICNNHWYSSSDPDDNDENDCFT